MNVAQDNGGSTGEDTAGVGSGEASGMSFDGNNNNNPAIASGSTGGDLSCETGDGCGDGKPSGEAENGMEVDPGDLTPPPSDSK